MMFDVLVGYRRCSMMFSVYSRSIHVTFYSVFSIYIYIYDVYIIYVMFYNVFFRVSKKYPCDVFKFFYSITCFYIFFLMLCFRCYLFLLFLCIL